MQIKVITVSSLNQYIKKMVDNDFILNRVYIKGELSNVKLHSSGHLYFSLKDEGSKINCVMFREYAKKLSFLPEDGMMVLIRGKVSVYAKEGSYQLYCEEMKIEGMGELHIAFEKLKEKLENKGLFDMTHKKSIPQYVSKVGVITSPTGAAIRDIMNVMQRRNKHVDILIYPALVQGENAPRELIAGIEYFNKNKRAEVIILARGGGSIEELWAFNDEALAQAVYDSKIPIITGVGHETDFTIVDFISDRRAATPSAAAELAVQTEEEIIDKIEGMKRQLFHSMHSNLSTKQREFESMKKSLMLNSPIHHIVNQYHLVDRCKKALTYSMEGAILEEKQKLGKMSAVLSACNPLSVLNKGYAILQDEQGHVVSSVKQLEEERVISVNMKDGKVKITIAAQEVL